MIKWRWHQLWNNCTIRSSSWNGSRVNWQCSCRKSFTVQLWKEVKR